MSDLDAELKDVKELCVECRLCIKECDFLKGVCENPKELVEKFTDGYFKENSRVPYSCTLCDLCESVCPSELNIGEMYLQLRQQMVEEGLGPLPAHKFVKSDQEFVLSDSFALSLPDPPVRERAMLCPTHRTRCAGGADWIVGAAGR